MTRFLLLGLVCTTAASAALARDLPARAPSPIEAAATECFAESIGNNPSALALARNGRWYEAAGVIGFLCRPEVEAMVRAHDQRHGWGSGDRYFRGAYTRHLARALEDRLKPVLATQAVANAEPRADAEAPAPKP
ncbi:hypothetical protein [Methylobacterium sp. ID0610]|uniref:hypothetical protein n=1 Tax=Methylobacterium carpenticola TaxID=3344827 RepID=UPI0036740B83